MDNYVIINHSVMWSWILQIIVVNKLVISEGSKFYCVTYLHMKVVKSTVIVAWFNVPAIERMIREISSIGKSKIDLASWSSMTGSSGGDVSFPVSLWISLSFSSIVFLYFSIVSSFSWIVWSFSWMVCSFSWIVLSLAAIVLFLVFI